jgi:alanine racemase
LANSAALATRTDCWGNMVRPGLALYGYVNCAHGLDLRPVLSLRARILSIREAPAGTAIGYGGKHVTRAAARIAVIATGYANGISRALSGRGQALVRGKRVPIVGLVTMDLTLLDVTAAPGAAAGDVATLIGEDGGERITAVEVAHLAGTVPYDVLAGIHSRVCHIYNE